MWSHSTAAFLLQQVWPHILLAASLPDLRSQTGCGHVPAMPEELGPGKETVFKRLVRARRVRTKGLFTQSPPPVADTAAAPWFRPARRTRPILPLVSLTTQGRTGEEWGEPLYAIHPPSLYRTGTARRRGPLPPKFFLGAGFLTAFRLINEECSGPNTAGPCIPPLSLLA